MISYLRKGGREEYDYERDNTNTIYQVTSNFWGIVTASHSLPVHHMTSYGVVTSTDHLTINETAVKHTQCTHVKGYIVVTAVMRFGSDRLFLKRSPQLEAGSWRG